MGNEGIKGSPTAALAAYTLVEDRLELVERFPLTNVGKVSKAELRDDIAKKLADE